MTTKIVGAALDLVVLEEYERGFVCPEGTTEVRIAKRTGRCEKQVYALLNKPRFCRWIEFGVTLRSGWLSPAGKRRLAELRGSAQGVGK